MTRQWHKHNLNIFIPNAALYTQDSYRRPFNILVLVFRSAWQLCSIMHKKAWLLMYMSYKSHKSCKWLCYLGCSNKNDHPYKKCNHVLNVFWLYSMINIRYVPAYSFHQCLNVSNKNSIFLWYDPFEDRDFFCWTTWCL